MSLITILTEPTVTLLSVMGGDSSVVQAARVSIVGENTPEESETDGLINYLMKHRHGSPFEHTAMTFYVKAPIYVLREFQRHRAGFSYNEMSGRYTELLPEFFVPPTTRGIKNVGTSARPVMELGDFEVTARGILQLSFEKSWEEYQRLLRHGVAREVARAVLPVGIMSQMYVTCNARSLMHFLSLRTSNADAVQRSYPQYEIEQVALLLESALEQHFPRVYAAFVASGRVAP